MCASCITLKQALEDSHASEQELQRNIEALQAQLLRTARAEQAARAELTKHREDSPKAVEIRSVLDHYVQKFGKTKSYKVGSDTARWKSVDRMLKLGYTTDELREAIDGLHAVPFVGPKGRQAQGGDRHDDITLCFRDETHVDRFRGYLTKAKVKLELAAPIPLRPIDRWLDALDALGIRWRGSIQAIPEIAWESQCPVHLDPGYAVLAQHNEAHELEVSCSSACRTGDVLRAVGLEPSALTEGAGFTWVTAQWRVDRKPARVPLAA